LPDPCRTRIQLTERANASIDALTQFIEALRLYDPDCSGIVISDLIRQLYPAGTEQPSVNPDCITMRNALENLVGCPPGKTPGPRQVGNKLKHYRRRVVNGRYLDANPNEQRRNGAVWRLHSVKSGAGLRLCDSVTLISAPSREESCAMAF
jgi:hypothetical protein